MKDKKLESLLKGLKNDINKNTIKLFDRAKRFKPEKKQRFLRYVNEARKLPKVHGYYDISASGFKNYVEEKSNENSISFDFSLNWSEQIKTEEGIIFKDDTKLWWDWHNKMTKLLKKYQGKRISIYIDGPMKYEKFYNAKSIKEILTHLQILTSLQQS